MQYHISAGYWCRHKHNKSEMCPRRSSTTHMRETGDAESRQADPERHSLIDDNKRENRNQGRSGFRCIGQWPRVSKWFHDYTGNGTDDDSWRAFHQIRSDYTGRARPRRHKTRSDRGRSPRDASHAVTTPAATGKPIRNRDRAIWMQDYDID